MVLDPIDMPPELFNKPRIPSQHSFGMKAPEDAPRLVTDKGIHIYAGNRPGARKLQRLCERYPEMWEETGPIDIPEDQTMKIPLVDGY